MHSSCWWTFIKFSVTSKGYANTELYDVKRKKTKETRHLVAPKNQLKDVATKIEHPT